MSAPQAASVKLPLSPSELWTVHHVLLDRIELERRSPSTTDPPPIEVFQAFEKIEAGDSWFTPLELRYMRAELKRYLDRANGAPDRAAVEQIIDRITSTLTGRHPARPAVSSDRHTRPR